MNEGKSKVMRCLRYVMVSQMDVRLYDEPLEECGCFNRITGKSRESSKQESIVRPVEENCFKPSSFQLRAKNFH